MGRIPKYSRKQLLGFKCTLLRTYNTFLKINNLHQQASILFATVMCGSEGSGFSHTLKTLFFICTISCEDLFVQALSLRVLCRGKTGDGHESRTAKSTTHCSPCSPLLVLRTLPSGTHWKAHEQLTDGCSAPLTLSRTADRLCCGKQSMSWQLYLRVLLQPGSGGTRL